MALYELKEFLNFDDVAFYLRDKGLFEFNDSYDRVKLNDFLLELVKSEKLTPVFHYKGTLTALNDVDITDIVNLDSDINFHHWKANKVFLFNDEMIEFWQNQDTYYPNFKYYQDNHTSICTYLELESREPFILLQDKNPQYGNEPLFPKSQLDQLFLQQQRDNLQRQIDLIDSQLNERTENSYLTTIGLLLELLKTPKGFDKDNKPNKPLFDSNAQIIQAITDYKIYGQGESTLENRFGKANTALDQAKKK